jgi:uncharacterized delta-60 repeat protein
MTRLLPAVLFSFLTTVAFSQPGGVDPTFNPIDIGASYGEMAGGNVICSLVLPDGKIVLGGWFVDYNGVPANHLVRLNANGTVDTSFKTTVGPDAAVTAMALHTDGHLLIGMWGARYDGKKTGTLARVKPDGSLDATFNNGKETMTNVVYTIAVEKNGGVLVGGRMFLHSSPVRYGIIRFNADGTPDNSFNDKIAFDNNQLPPEVFSIDIDANDKIVVAGSFSNYSTIAASNIVRLNGDGTLDNTFNAVGTEEETYIRSVSIQTDGKMIVAGNFDTFNGSERKNIARIDAGGSLDPSFDPGESSDDEIEATAILSEGRIAVAGKFHNCDGLARNHVAVLNTDGTVSPDFLPGNGITSTFKALEILDLAAQSDGKLLIGGTFDSYNGVPMGNFVRINPDGNVDASMNVPGTGAGFGYVQNIAIQSDKKIVIGGNFQFYNGASRNGIARVNADGTLDNTFNVGTGVNGLIQAIAVQADNRIIIGGAFTSYNSVGVNRICRLNADGTLDATFNTGAGTNYPVHDIAIQPDGKVLIGGTFSTYDAVTKRGLVRLNADGSIDNSFACVVHGDIYSISLQTDSKILVAGQFSKVNDVVSFLFGRLNADGSLHTAAPMQTLVGVHHIMQLAGGKIIITGGFQYVGNDLRAYVARLNTDLTLDKSFNTGGGSTLARTVTSAVEQPDGKLIVAGPEVSAQSTTGSIRYSHIARLTADGKFDNDFQAVTGANQSVHALALQSDGRLIVGGAFTQISNGARNKLARLLTTCDEITATASFDDGQLTVTTNAISPTYQWINCNGNANIVGATSATFTPTASGSYKASVTNGGCQVASTCLNVTIVGLEDDLESFRIFPNPSKGKFAIDLGSETFTSLRIYDITGRVVYNENGILGGVRQIDVNVPQGLYILSLSGDSKTKRDKFVID